jgi:hypothetical protein
MAGWCLGNLFRLTARERLFCMIISLAPDLDGLGLLFGKFVYLRYHHVLCHNLAFGILSSLLLSLLSSQRLKSFFLYLGLFHLHLLMDYLGSGPGWPVVYFYPFSNWRWVNEKGWAFNGWQNIIMNLFLVWVFIQIWQKGRTPFELVWPSLDKYLIRKAKEDFKA